MQHCAMAAREEEEEEKEEEEEEEVPEDSKKEEFSAVATCIMAKHFGWQKNKFCVGGS